MSARPTRPEPHNAPDLHLVQRWFQTVITHPDGVEAGCNSEEARGLIQVTPGGLEKVLTKSQMLASTERIAIYAHAYYSRLLECLGEVFPMLKRALGEDAFSGFAFGYLQQHPSRSYTLNDLGREFARYLSDTRPVAEEQPGGLTGEDWPDFLIDLANLEWTIYEVFDGPGHEGKPTLRGDDLLDIPREAWPNARFTPVPCLRLQSTRFPVNAYYSDVRRSKPEDHVPIPPKEPEFLALTRREYIVRRHSFQRVQFAVLRGLVDGLTLGTALERAAEATGPDEFEKHSAGIPQWFRDWASAEFFQAVEA